MSAKNPHSEHDDPEVIFHAIIETLAQENQAVTPGKMMSSPGIKYHDKVFAFYDDHQMVFRLGKDFRPETHGIYHYSLLSPFKTKAPMADWFQITAADQDKWETLARYALRRMMGG
jgi:hypothetical protein